MDSLLLQLAALKDETRSSFDQVRLTLDARVRDLQNGNAIKLDEMRQAVDERLQGTLEKRLGESFLLVSERLEAVHRGLGEMQSLAVGVGDLKKVLTNVKARGVWGEVALGNILEQILAPGQYERNVRVREESGEVVEFALKLPGTKGEPDSYILLPIDSKFPHEDYLRIHEAADRGDPEAVQRATTALSASVRAAARSIS